MAPRLRMQDSCHLSLRNIAVPTACHTAVQHVSLLKEMFKINGPLTSAIKKKSSFVSTAIKITVKAIDCLHTMILYPLRNFYFMFH